MYYVLKTDFPVSLRWRSRTWLLHRVFEAAIQRPLWDSVLLSGPFWFGVHPLPDAVSSSGRGREHLTGALIQGKSHWLSPVPRTRQPPRQGKCGWWPRGMEGTDPGACEDRSVEKRRGAAQRRRRGRAGPCGGCRPCCAHAHPGFVAWRHDPWTTAPSLTWFWS